MVYSPLLHHLVLVLPFLNTKEIATNDKVIVQSRKEERRGEEREVEKRGEEKGVEEREGEKDRREEGRKVEMRRFKGGGEWEKSHYSIVLNSGLDRNTLVLIINCYCM